MDCAWSADHLATFGQKTFKSTVIMGNWSFLADRGGQNFIHQGRCSSGSSLAAAAMLGVLSVQHAVSFSLIFHSFARTKNGQRMPRYFVAPLFCSQLMQTSAESSLEQWKVLLRAVSVVYRHPVVPCGSDFLLSCPLILIQIVFFLYTPGPLEGRLLGVAPATKWMTAPLPSFFYLLIWLQFLIDPSNEGIV